MKIGMGHRYRGRGHCGDGHGRRVRHDGAGGCRGRPGLCGACAQRDAPAGTEPQHWRGRGRHGDWSRCRPIVRVPWATLSTRPKTTRLRRRMRWLRDTPARQGCRASGHVPFAHPQGAATRASLGATNKATPRGRQSNISLARVTRKPWKPRRISRAVPRRINAFACRCTACHWPRWARNKSARACWSQRWARRSWDRNPS